MAATGRSTAHSTARHRTGRPTCEIPVSHSLGVSLICQNNCSVVPRVANHATNALVDGLHAAAASLQGPALQEQQHEDEETNNNNNNNSSSSSNNSSKILCAAFGMS